MLCLYTCQHICKLRKKDHKMNTRRFKEILKEELQIARLVEAKDPNAKYAVQHYQGSGAQKFYLPKAGHNNTTKISDVNTKIFSDRESAETAAENYKQDRESTTTKVVKVSSADLSKIAMASK